MTQDLKTKIAEAIRDSKIEMLVGLDPRDRMRGLTYYASVGVDYLKHNHAKAFPALIDAATQAALQAIHDAGYRVVPLEPTREMNLAGVEAESWRSLGLSKVHRVWRAMLGAAETGSAAPDTSPTIADYEGVLADHRRLTRELDVLLNGEDAAERPSLCDIVGQLRALEAAGETVRLFPSSTSLAEEG